MAAVVVVFNWSWCKVTLREELMGRIRSSSRFPQYLMTAMLTGAVQVTATSGFSEAMAQ